MGEWPNGPRINSHPSSRDAVQEQVGWRTEVGYSPTPPWAPFPLFLEIKSHVAQASLRLSMLLRLMLALQSSCLPLPSAPARARSELGGGVEEGDSLHSSEPCFLERICVHASLLGENVVTGEQSPGPAMLPHPCKFAKETSFCCLVCSSKGVYVPS